MRMRLALAVVLSLAAFAFALVTGTKDNYTIHIGARTPPAEARCQQIGVESTDEGRVLGVYSCPT